MYNISQHLKNDEGHWKRPNRVKVVLPFMQRWHTMTFSRACQELLCDLKAVVIPIAHSCSWVAKGNKQLREVYDQVQQLQPSQEVVIRLQMHSAGCCASLSVVSPWPLAWVFAFCDERVSLNTHSLQAVVLPVGLIESGSPIPVCQWICILHLVPTPSNHPGQGHALSSGPPSSTSLCVLTLPSSQRCHREHPCSSPCFFPPGPLKNPRYPCNFRCNVYLAEWGIGGEGGRASCIEKEPHSQTVWAALEGKHVQEECTRRVVKELRLVCSGPDTQIPPQQEHRAALCSFPNRLSLINIPLPPLVCSIDSALCWRVEDMTEKTFNRQSWNKHAHKCCNNWQSKTMNNVKHLGLHIQPWPL